MQLARYFSDDRGIGWAVGRRTSGVPKPELRELTDAPGDR